MITYTIEKLPDYLSELKEISKLHYSESCPYDDIPLNVDWQKLLLMEQHNILKFYVMKKSDKLIGYATFYVSKSVEYKDSKQATMSNIFIHPDHRGRGARFILWCDEQLKSEGVQVVYHHVNSKFDYGVLLKRLGYDIMKIEYSKRLDK